MNPADKLELYAVVVQFRDLAVQYLEEQPHQDRNLIVTTLDWNPDDQLSVFGSAWIDYYTSSDDVKGEGVELTNVRASGSDEAVRLTTPVTLSLEQAIAYIDDDELVEVTPNAIRLRKRHLDPHERKRASRSAA